MHSSDTLGKEGSLAYRPIPLDSLDLRPLSHHLMRLAFEPPPPKFQAHTSSPDITESFLVRLLMTLASQRTRVVCQTEAAAHVCRGSAESRAHFPGLLRLVFFASSTRRCVRRIPRFVPTGRKGKTVEIYTQQATPVTACWYMWFMNVGLGACLRLPAPPGHCTYS